MASQSTRDLGSNPRRVVAQGIVGLAALFVSVAPSFGGNPVAEMAKDGTGFTSGDPRGESWSVMQQSFAQFAHPEFLLRLALSLALSVACAWVVAWHPRRSAQLDPLTDLEERNTLIVLGLVGAVIAELSFASQTLAFVIFGIGALVRFRTVLDNPKLSGKAIMVVVIGLACGTGQWAMAVFVTIFCWGLIFWLDSHMSCRIRVKLSTKLDLHRAEREARDVLVSRGCRVKTSSLDEGKRQLVFMVHIPTTAEPKSLEAELRSKLPSGESADIDFRVV
ncbi:MAG: hypothetical protein U0572_03895 [Phycisphaerales bacterium]